MPRSILAAAALAALLSPASAQPAFDRPLTLGMVCGSTPGCSGGILASLRGLDGRTLVVKQNGSESVIMQAWEFGSAAVRMKVARDLYALQPNERIEETARQKLVAEIVQKMPPGTTEIKAGTPEWTMFINSYRDLLDQPAAIGGTIAPIDLSELKLDKNEIPVSVISGLMPLIVGSSQ